VGHHHNLTLNATANPDFSQVEADVQRCSTTPVVGVVPRETAFFVEGSEQFDAPNNLIYTGAWCSRRGLKLNGKAAG